MIAPIEESAGKANVLFQTYISQGKLTGFTVISDTNYVAQNAGRIGRALFEVSLRTVREWHKSLCSSIYKGLMLVVRGNIVCLAGMVLSGYDLPQDLPLSRASGMVVSQPSKAVWGAEL